MFEEFNHLPRAEQLKAANDFMAMKLMAENGAVIGISATEDLRMLEIQNAFLQNVIEFEKNYANAQYVPLRERINLEDEFPPAFTISDKDMPQAWTRLRSFLLKKGIDLAVRSPRVSPGELYRFVMEELVNMEVAQRPMPGYMHCFVYDEFHPDREFEACSAAQYGCILPLLAGYPMPPSFCFHGSGIHLNHYQFLNHAQFLEHVDSFRMRFEEIIPRKFTITKCRMGMKQCLVKGTYSVVLQQGGESSSQEGEWEVTLTEDTECDLWLIAGLEIEGLEF